MAKQTEKRMIPPPIPPSPNARLDARTRAENKSQEAHQQQAGQKQGEKPVEIGGPKGLEPTRYGDWEKAGRCFDF